MKDEREAREEHEKNLLATVGEEARNNRDVRDIARNAAHQLYLRDARIRQLEKWISEFTGRNNS